MNLAKRVNFLTALGVVLLGALFLPHAARSHCDTLDGPVVQDAKLALAQKEVTPVLKWVKPEHEKEVREAFEKSLKVRGQGPEAQELADRYFLETLVRLHRAGEGEPFTGLKPAGTDLGPAVAGADQALATGKVDNLVKQVTGDVEKGIRERFSRALEKKQHQAESVAAGREYVSAYVEFVHYVERLHQAAVSRTAPSEKSEAPVPQGAHHH